jgi:hypothetical protein
MEHAVELGLHFISKHKGKRNERRNAKSKKQMRNTCRRNEKIYQDKSKTKTQTHLSLW